MAAEVGSLRQTKGRTALTKQKKLTVVPVRLQKYLISQLLINEYQHAKTETKRNQTRELCVRLSPGRKCGTPETNFES